MTREALLAHWASGWSALHEAVDALTDADLQRTITIRQQPMAAHEALHRSFVEYAFGFVVGMTFTFGAELPALVALVVAALSALSHFAVRAVRSSAASLSR